MAVLTEPRCTCDPAKLANICRDIRKEPHLAGCPRWGTPLPDPLLDIEAAFGILRDAPYQPNPYDRLMAEALNSAEETGREKERRRWLGWLADIGYGQDFTFDDEPPCSPRELAEVLNERQPLDMDATPGYTTGADLWLWTLAECTGYGRCGNCRGDITTCDCDDS